MAEKDIREYLITGICYDDAVDVMKASIKADRLLAEIRNVAYNRGSADMESRIQLGDHDMGR